MEKGNRMKLIEAYERLGHENPDRYVHRLIKELKKKGQYLYVVHPIRVQPGSYPPSAAEPKCIRLFKN